MDKRDWKFWFAIMGSISTAIIMFSDIKTDLAVQRIEIEYVKKDMAAIKEHLGVVQKGFAKRQSQRDNPNHPKLLP